MTFSKQNQSPFRGVKFRQLKMVSMVSTAAISFTLFTGCGLEGQLTEPSTPSTTSTAPAEVNTTPPTELVPSETVEAVAEEVSPVNVGTGALATVDNLTVKGRAPKTGYSRDQFGQSWADVDRNGCDTRNDILRRDLTNVNYKDNSTCVIASGVLEVDPYTGQRIDWLRGEKTSSAVQIDHVVALSDAWQKGAQQWTPEVRQQFANDPLNLIAADGPANQSKGDGDTATWLPPNNAYRCEYVARQVAVKHKYGVWVTDAEQQAMRDVLTTCPDQPLPADSSEEVVVPARS